MPRLPGHFAADRIENVSELRIDTWQILAAELGPENPLPSFNKPRYQPVLSGKPDGDPTAGYLPDYLPYSMQDGYTRQRQPTEVKVAVLENATLRATFLLDYGGRLWSLLHKPSGRELLYVNSHFQPANLAIRNAWFSGGVEWNMGIGGHSPFTCSPVFAARVETPDGTPVLRLYEWERIRQAAYQVDAYLPDDSQVLYIRVRLVNPFDQAIPMYWWSNIAVAEREDVRVLVPAAEAYRYALSVEDLQTIPVPVVDGQDITYTTNGRRSADYFFLLPEGRRPWISALDADGKGLIQVSTAALRGRKLFLWGTAAGGKRWQGWLNGPGESYLEIQAGLAPTQLEYVQLPPRADLSWLEAYGLMEADPQVVHGSDWNAACAAVEARLERMAPAAQLETELQRGAAWQDQPPFEILHRGSGWGGLEALRREIVGERPFAGQGLEFSDVLDSKQQPWVALLQTGRFPDNDADDPVGGALVQTEWQTLLENAIQQNPEASWEAWLHLGNMRLHAGNVAGARQAWETSVARKRTPWALRNLGVIAQREANMDAAAAYYREAQALRPDLLPLLIETGRALIDAGYAREFIALLVTIPSAMREIGRVHLLEVEAGLATGDFERAGKLLNGGFEVTDYQEGDEILTQLWFEYQAERVSRSEGIALDEKLRDLVRHEYPLPAIFDFRMTVE